MKVSNDPAVQPLPPKPENVQIPPTSVPITSQLFRYAMYPWRGYARITYNILGKLRNRLTAISKKNLDPVDSLICVLAIDSVLKLTSSGYSRGWIFGAIEAPISLTIIDALINAQKRNNAISAQKTEKPDSKPDDKYVTTLTNLSPMDFAVVIPTVEEIFFRGIVQNGIQALTGSPALAILLSASYFGLVHLENEHEHNKMQAITCGVVGIGLGCLNYFYGMAGALGAHMARNGMIGLILHSRQKRPQPCS